MFSCWRGLPIILLIIFSCSRKDVKTSFNYIWLVLERSHKLVDNVIKRSIEYKMYFDSQFWQANISFPIPIAYGMVLRSLHHFDFSILKHLQCRSIWYEYCHWRKTCNVFLLLDNLIYLKIKRAWNMSIKVHIIFKVHEIWWRNESQTYGRR